MGFLDIWEKTFGSKSPPRPGTRLSDAEAIEIARAAVDDGVRDQMTMTTVIERDGAVIWHVSQCVIGRTMHVEIDDSTGQVLRVFAAGIR